MINEKKILDELKNDGISIIHDFYDKKFCSTGISDINKSIKNYNYKIINNKSEGTSGDYRIFKIDNISSNALKFKNNNFLNNIYKSITNNKIKSYFILGGKVEFKKNEINNSGGGWHRDSDEEQYKAMVYLNDVDENNGPFLFIKDSDKFDLERRKINQKKSIMQKIFYALKRTKKYPPRYSDTIVNEFLKKNKIKPLVVTGKAGTVVLFNATFLHRGKNISQGVRYTYTNYMFKKHFISNYFRNRQFNHLFIKD